MRLLWLTPVHRRSAIARFSELVVGRLIAAGYDVSVGSSQTSFDPADQRPFFDLPITTASRQLADSDTFDVIIANFGDHYPNHGLALEALSLPLVIGIFHDADMTNFGNGMRADGRDVLREESEWPLGRAVTSAIARRCSGAIAHSQFYQATVRACDGPVAVIPLAWSPPSWAEGQSAPWFPPKADGFRLVTFGNINLNKCPDRVIEAISLSPLLRQAVEYRLIGAIEPEVEKILRDLADRLNVNLSVLGPVSDAELMEELALASAVSCLREPVLEGASASAIEAMMQSCAVIVSDAGFYADLPDDSVIKVPAGTEVVAIKKMLEDFLADPHAAVSLRQRAQEYALATFSPHRYADALLRLAEDVRVSSAYQPLIDRIAKQLGDLGVSPENGAVDHVLRSIEGMAPVIRRSDPHSESASSSDCNARSGNSK